MTASHWKGYFVWKRVLRTGMDSSNGIKTIPARSANFQPEAPFQHVVLSSNPLGFKGSSYLITEHHMFAFTADGVQRLAVACSSPDRTGFSLHSNKLLHSVATEIREKEAR